MADPGASDLPVDAALEPVPIDRAGLLEALAWDSVTLVDAQAPGWYERERLPGALRGLPEDLSSLEHYLPLGRETPVVVYCWDASCSGSAVVARMLLERGFKRVGRYRGGKRDWMDAGLPVERGSP